MCWSIANGTSSSSSRKHVLWSRHGILEKFADLALNNNDSQKNVLKRSFNYFDRIRITVLQFNWVEDFTFPNICLLTPLTYQHQNLNLWQ